MTGTDFRIPVETDVLVLSVIYLLLLGLFLSRRWLWRWTGSLLYRVSTDHKFVAGAHAFLFWPGTLFHELAHAGMAWVLNVPVEKISLLPSVGADGRRYLGYVSTGPSGPFRRLAICMAPLPFAIAALYGIAGYVDDRILSGDLHALGYFAIIYGTVQVAQAMFPSDVDVEITAGLAQVSGLLLVAATFVIVAWDRSPIANLTPALDGVAVALGMALGLTIIVIGVIVLVAKIGRSG